MKMLSRKLLARTTLTASAVAAAGFFAAAGVALAYQGEELATQAKITIEQARAIALQAHAGKITDEELEKERGGNGLRYSFDIKSGSRTYEVGVDAISGKVLENKREGKNPD